MGYDELTPASITAIGAGALDIIATWNEDTGDLFDFGPTIQMDFGVDAASRIPDGTDTDMAGDWVVNGTFDLAIELGDANDTFATPGAANMVPEPAGLSLVLFGLAAFVLRRKNR